VFLWEPESWLILQQMRFDLVLNVDKSQRSGAFARTLQTRKTLGFGIGPKGAIIPLNPEAMPNYLLGLDDHAKFRVNTKTVVQMLREQFVLDDRMDEYLLTLSPEERRFRDEFCRTAGIAPPGSERRDLVVGLNTGCSELYPNKKLTIDQHVTLIERLSAFPGIRCVLLGGPEDTSRNAEIARRAGPQAIATPTNEGVRHGLLYLDLCDVVISGDSFGMHAAIALKKHVIVWFGVSCPQEIELYGRGMKLIPHGLECSPCWKRECPYDLECLRMVNLDAIVAEVVRLQKVRA
jgi:heptosyltransferase-2